MTKEKITRINTDLEATSKRSIYTPFESFWVPNRKAYLTPDNDEYRAPLSRLKPGDVVVAAEDKKGIVGLGVVLRKCDFNEDPVPGLYPNERTWKLDVAWDESVKVPFKVVQQINSDKSAGVIKQGTSFSGAISGLSAPLYPFVYDAARRALSHADHKTGSEDQLDPNPEKDRVIDALARIGHDDFKKSLQPVRCRVTGTTAARLLIASHIVPWKHCVGREHLDPDNGLLLAPHVDYLFDRHLISFDPDGQSYGFTLVGARRDR